MNMIKVFFMRGIPGMGKSTKADILCDKYDAPIVSADHFFTDSNGMYNFNPSYLGEAHNSCFSQFKRFFSMGKNVIIDNCNLRFSDIEKYLVFLDKQEQNFEICFVNMEDGNNLSSCIENRTNQENGKNIPESKIRLMFESYLIDMVSEVKSKYPHFHYFEEN